MKYILCLLLCFFILKLKPLAYKLNGLTNRCLNYTPITYLKHDYLTPVSRRRLQQIRRKTLILDMDETLISSVIKSRRYWQAHRPSRRIRYEQIIQRLPWDYCFPLHRSNAMVYVYKRPYVDFFLETVAKWYNLVVFTAATEGYASKVLDYLDAGRNILNRRLFRQHCIEVCGIRAKYVSLVEEDLSNVVLLDNCCMANSFNVGNALYIKSFRRGNQDNQLLCMLPFLDALRFTKDVRSVLGRSRRFDNLTLDLAAAKKKYLTGRNKTTIK
ncbi:CG12078 [Drosophila busckii]|uniref:CG12078 n=1 Tax=Drosophila busckii TaxID=30019 RepID=A0A0M5J5I3_DROBS|nr:CTD nuclear envelope phosphatase 1 isoform X2 [Drosophila busckii]ALC43068.1 CG12078 [Drosophila busckii]